MSQDPAPTEAAWQDWAKVTAADLAEPTFQALVGEIEADQRAWATEYTATLAERSGASDSEVSGIERRDEPS